MSHEIEESKPVESTPRKSEQTLSDAREQTMTEILDRISDGFVIFDRKWRYVYVNSAAEELTHMSREELLGKVLWDLFPAADQLPFGRAYRRAMDEKVMVKVEAYYPEPLNAWFEVRCYPSAEGLNVFFIDVTERKQAEQKLTSQAELLNIAHDAIMVRSLDGIIAFWNHGAEEMYGHSSEQAIGRVSHELLLAGFPLPLAEIEEIVLREGRWEGELIHTARDGSRIVVASRWVLQLDEKGRPSRVMEINNDITEQKRAEVEIRKLNESLEQRVLERTAQLEAANKELEAFCYTVSHDLRSPLRTVDGFSHAVLEEYGSLLPEEGVRCLKTVRGGAQRMGMLIDGLLAFSRLTRAPVNKEEVNTNQLVQGALDELRYMREGRQIDLRIGALPACSGDPILLRQVWVNLLSNAFKFTKQRDAVAVEIGCKSEPVADVFFVRDNGIGFDTRYAGKLFGVFQRLNRVEEFEGTGVGLAIVQRIRSIRR